MPRGSEIRVHTYPNGLTLVAESMPFVRSAAFRFLIPAGVVNDPEGCEGAARVLYGLSFRGAGGRNSRELSDALDALGLQRNGGAGDELTTFGGVLLGEDLPAALEIHADVICRPHLPGDQLTAEKALALQDLDSLEENPMQKTFVELRRIYLPGPYGRCQLGTRDGIQNLSIDALQAEHARRYRPEGAILAVAGNCMWDPLQQEVERLFGAWQGEAVKPPPMGVPCTNRCEHIPHPSNQEQIGVAYQAVPAEDDQFYEGLMAVQVLSGGMSARLFTEVREKRGLVYGVFAAYQTLKGLGFVLCYAGTTPERSQETLNVLLAELVRLREGVLAEEVERARSGLLSRLVMSGESSSARATAVASDYYLRGRVRTMEEIRAAIEAVTPESVAAYLSAHPPDDFTVLTLGPRLLSVYPDKQEEGVP